MSVVVPVFAFYTIKLPIVRSTNDAGKTGYPWANEAGPLTNTVHKNQLKENAQREKGIDGYYE